LLIIAFIVGGLVTYQLEKLFRGQFISDKTNNTLLSQIYPGRILSRIRSGENFIADTSDATVVFIDIVEFTALARTMSVVRLIEVLNGLFSIFDYLAVSHGVEKIKTIGDGYMAVSGAGVTSANDTQ